jgi:hypothetical protein
MFCVPFWSIQPSITRSSDITVAFANGVRSPEKSHELQVVRARVLQHFLGRDTFILVVFKTLVARDIADGVEG